ncbi:hypothetical protein [Mesorhizobium loti]|uniref:hypothetical protein n=1 Tax=Rhizobium loti TaxID=381 RepID=UPI000414E446|nr:hypothetical protein [Mesorhizobium loti]
MASIFKKTVAAPAAEPFRVPNLAEADPETYGALVQKRDDLTVRLRALKAEAANLTQLIEADTSRDVRPALAALLGDEPGTKSINRGKLAETQKLSSDLSEAIGVIEQRIRDAKSGAVRRLVALARPEWDRRFSALTEGLKIAAVAYRDLDKLREDLDAEDAASHFTNSVNYPSFLGSARDGHLTRFLRETDNA